MQAGRHQHGLWSKVTFTWILWSVCLLSCHPVKTAMKTDEGSSGSEGELEILLRLNRDVYIMTHWAEAPQFAIWLEDETGNTIKTLFVTQCTGKGLWQGKIDCPVSLPYWVTRYNMETNTQGAPTFHRPIPDAVTGATPKTQLRFISRLTQNFKGFYYLEINVSGDFNQAFPQWDKNGEEDAYGNGQPSLVYRGHLDAQAKTKSPPVLIGRSLQREPTNSLHEDLEGITRARSLLSTFAVEFRAQ